MKPLSALYSGVSHLRNRLFDAQLLSQESLSVPVVSVGNITAGGTGKTPMVIHLAQQLKARGIDVGIVSRGYGRDQKGTLEVLGNKVDHFGDEPVLMKRALGGVPIFVSASRVEAGRALLASYNVDLILADDAFQHRYLKRDRDIVLIDATQPLEQYRLLPEGLAREAIAGLSRAHQLIFTKMGTKNSLTASELKTFLRPHVPEQLLADAIEAKYSVSEPVAFNGGLKYDPKEPCTLVSAIGRPEAFEAMCREKWGVNIQTHLRFRDHHRYLLSDLKGVGKGPVLTTEKDMVKVMNLEFDFSQWFYVPLAVEMQSGSERLYEDIVRLCS